MQARRNKLAAVVDIDGVLVQQKEKLPGATQGIELLQKQGIPFVFFTNNTSKSEQHKADELTKLLGLKTPIQKEQIILNYTPIKKTFESWHDKLVLFVGRQEINDILPFQEIPYYITIDQYCTIFPQAVPFSKRPADKIQDVSERVKKRLNMTELDIHKIKFDLIFTLNSPVRWEECIQVILDLLSTNDGTVSRKSEYVHHSTHIPIYTALNDLWFRRKDHPLPRLLVKPFNMALEAVYREIYKGQLNLIHYGKPTRKAFEFVHRHMQLNYGQSQSYVMIGDNIDTDIQGAFNYGWKSVLVLTGVSKHTSEKADHCCNNLHDAVQWCIKSINSGVTEGTQNDVNC